MILANTRVRIGQGSGGKNEWDDPVGGTVDPSVEAVPASLIEHSRVVLDDTTGDARTLVWAVLRASPTIAKDIGLNTLVEDTSTGTVWVVEEVRHRSRTMYGTSDVSFNLKVSAPSPTA